MARLKVRLKWRSDSGPVWRMPVYLSLVVMMFFLPFGSMRGRASSAEDVGEFFEREIDFEDVSAGLIAGSAWLIALRRGQRLTGIAVALADAAGVLLAVAELRQLDRRNRDADEIAPFFADHLSA